MEATRCSNNEITAVHVDRLPEKEEMEQGKLYVADKLQATAHLCGCGCGDRVVLAIDSTGWRYSENEGRPTLVPSIGNLGLPCKSCYRIHDGRIVLF